LFWKHISVGIDLMRVFYENQFNVKCEQQSKYTDPALPKYTPISKFPNQKERPSIILSFRAIRDTKFISTTPTPSMRRKPVIKATMLILVRDLILVPTHNAIIALATLPVVRVLDGGRLRGGGFASPIGVRSSRIAGAGSTTGACGGGSVCRRGGADTTYHNGGSRG
jgi:hypothetical protein